MNLDTSLYEPQRDIRQTAHAQEMRAVGIIQKTFSCSRSQAALLVRQQQDKNAQARFLKNPNEGNKIGPLFQDVPRIQQQAPQVEVVKTVISPRPPPEAVILPVIPGLEDSPNDVHWYGRHTGAWDRVTEESPNNNTIVYARKNRAWLDITSSLVLSADAAANVVLYTDPATANVTFTSGNLHFEFDIPAGTPGPKGDKGDDPTDAHLNDLITALIPADDDSAYALKPTGVATLGSTISDPVMATQVQDIVTKLDQLITALKI